MQNLTKMTIREIALEAPLTTRVFESFKIDFCCGGRVPFAEACGQAGADPLNVLSELEKVMELPSQDLLGSSILNSPRELIGHIVRTHHSFTRSEITRLIPLAEKVAVRHGESHSELKELREVFAELGEELLVHMRKEEAVLFPYIEQLDLCASTGMSAPSPHFGTVNNPVRMMMFEHERAGDLLRRLRSLSNDYTAPGDACPSYKGLYAGLEALELDLHRHIHLENNVLFPQAIKMESNMPG